jgi:exosome complex component RRP4
MALKIKDKELLVPGSTLGENIISPSEYCFRENNVVFSSVIGMGRAQGDRVNVIPSTGVYIPKEEDVIIAVVKEVYSNRWVLDINSPYECIMLVDSVLRENEKRKKSPKELFDVGDILSVKISEVNEVNFSRAIKPWKLQGGLILEVDPKRIPRVIGKKKSMLNLIKDKTQCKVIVGQNGRVWIKDPINMDKEKFIVEIINKIVREAQTQGLTNKIEKILNEEMKRWKQKI